MARVRFLPVATPAGVIYPKFEEYTPFVHQYEPALPKPSQVNTSLLVQPSKGKRTQNEPIAQHHLCDSAGEYSDNVVNDYTLLQRGHSTGRAEKKRSMADVMSLSSIMSHCNVPCLKSEPRPYNLGNSAPFENCLPEVPFYHPHVQRTTGLHDQLTSSDHGFERRNINNTPQLPSLRSWYPHPPPHFQQSPFCLPPKRFTHVPKHKRSRIYEAVRTGDGDSQHETLPTLPLTAFIDAPTGKTARQKHMLSIRREHYFREVLNGYTS